MTIIYLILPLALVLAGGAVAAFFWAARHGQYDDLDTPPLRMLIDDEEDASFVHEDAKRKPVDESRDEKPPSAP